MIVRESEWEWIKTNLDFIDHVYILHLEQLDGIFNQDKYTLESRMRPKEREKEKKKIFVMSSLRYKWQEKISHKLFNYSSNIQPDLQQRIARKIETYTHVMYKQATKLPNQLTHELTNLFIKIKSYPFNLHL